jgi:hypothetical protein
MEQLIPLLIVFALGFGAGYGVREWKISDTPPPVQWF